MAKKQHEQEEILATEEKLEKVEETLSKTEKYIEENRKSLSIIVIAIVAIIGGYFGYQRFIVAPAEMNAQTDMFTAEQYFEKDSFNLALKGDGNNLGFLYIIDEYGATPSANLAQYYAGICYLRLKDYDNAIEHLKNFDADDQMVSNIAIGAIGDAYMEKGNTKEAATYYLKAAKNKENEFTSPIYLKKAGFAYEKLKNYKKAVEIYEQLYNKYPRSTEGRSIEKYIERAKIQLSSK